MNPYKPEFMGSIAPFDDQVKLQDFLKNKYDSFSEIFDAVKDDAGKIESVTVVDLKPDGSTTLSVALETTGEVLEKLKKQITGTTTLFGNIITIQ